MLTSLRKVGSSFALLSAMLVTSSAFAQANQPAQGFAINRYNPAERGSEWFALDSLDFRDDFRPALGLTLDYAYKPLAIYSGEGEEKTALISDQVHLHLGGAVVLWERLRLGVNVPLVLTQSGVAGSAEGFTVTPPTGAAVGDVRVGADVRLIGTYRDPFTAAVGVQAFVPTGSRESFTGDEELRLLPRVLVAGNMGVFTYGAMLGVQYRGYDQGFAGKETGTEFTGGASAGLRLLDKKLVIGPELFGSTVISSAVERPSPASSPLELIIGAHYTAGSMRFGAGAGPGLTRGIGEPTLRALASIEYVPATDVDTDGDGILDKVDACVTIPGVADKDPKKHGCPPDRDGDRIYDKDDACVDVPGIAHKDPKKHGCPSDRDGDMIYDRDDACPDVPGAASNVATMHGCPTDTDASELVPLDRDGDKVIDDLDKCVDVPGLREAPGTVPADRRAEWTEKFLGCPEDIDGDKIANLPDACPFNAGRENLKDPKKHGCPQVYKSGCEIRITDRIFFKTQSPNLETIGERGKTTQSILTAVFEILRDNPEIKKMEVQGHASQDTYAKNQELSDLRAEVVVKWLVQKGIDPTRLVPKGYGTTVPAKGVTVDRKNKEIHQRVEFHQLEPQCDAATK
jgi:outer membrane protein OmpA-like peptidoglycan-associated protein